ncbi:PVC-type heme-binding CxxCH protein [Neorhodopirellula pilleata]|uniref:Auracyanin-A n=1 Tax=Neorhodopirellula pilleata TaxID=2714738 RepID=A0A5C5ZLK4_9BACT|nr:PVC-type heme-binding CxxCH protein [Neorhodopirellula pilleata]TWT88055.1 Auracyanin-A precursor [Neorhodopirellula pilleata]
MTFLTKQLCLATTLAISLVMFPWPLSAEPLHFQKGDHIALVGNELGERMQHQNQWETLLHQTHADKNLVVRNLCVPGDEPEVRLRSLNFGTPDDHLTHVQADVVLFFFGFNESFRLKDDVDHALVLKDFQKELTTVVNHTYAQAFNSEATPPRIALISPIAFEDTGNPHLPDAKRRNQALEAITRAMAEVAESTGATFADVFHPTLELFEKTEAQLTLQGAHLNDRGYVAFAPILLQALTGQDHSETTIDAKLKAEVDDKSFHFFNRYRTVNGYSIYGKRGEAGSDGTYRNREVMNRELEILDEMSANRDARIWAVAAGKDVADEVDDSNTLPFITPKTNVGGDNDPNAKNGKLGSLDYLPSNEQVKTFDLADGYQIQLVASEEQFPQLANPVALNFDAKGRLWVSTMPSYPHWKPKTPMDDQVLIFEDDNGDYLADRCITFARGLHQPTGFELGNGGAYIGNQHNVVFMKDTDGDDVADTRTDLLCGFDTADSHHGLAAFDWGPGGQLYLQEGTFKFSQIESPYGLTRLIEGGVWRFHPKTHQFGVHVNFSFANPWGFAFDYFDQDFIGDASPGYGYWAPPISGRLDYPLKHPGGSQHRRVASEQGYDDAHVTYDTFYQKRIRPLAGCALMSSSHFPDEMQGDFLVTNVIGERAILVHDVKEQDSGFVGTEVPMLVNGGDGNFRPVDIEIAPDGSLYVVDWHNALIGHLQHNLRDPNRDQSHGRIWRISHKTRPVVDAPVIADMPTAKLVQHLVSDFCAANQRHAYRVRRELWNRDSDAVLQAVQASVLADRANASPHDQLEALWMHQAHDVIDESLLKNVLLSDDHRIRAAGQRVLSYWMNRPQWQLSADETLALLRKGTSDTHPRVRLESLRGITFAVGESWALNIETDLIRSALSVLQRPVDKYLLYTLNEAMRRFEQVIENRNRFLPDPDQLASHHGGARSNRDDESITLVSEPSKVAGPTDHGSLLRTMPLFLEMPGYIVRYQIDRLKTAELLATSRNSQDAKYIPLHAAILARGDVSSGDRQAALDALIALQDSDPAAVLIDVTEKLDWKNPSRSAANAQAAQGLSKLLLNLPVSNLKSQKERLTKIATESSSPLASTAMAALISSGDADVAWSMANKSEANLKNWLVGVGQLPQKDDRIAQRPRVVEQIRSDNTDIVAAAITALATIPSDWAQTARLISGRIGNGKLRDTAVQALLKTPKTAFDEATGRQIAGTLVGVAEKTAKAKRTSDEFIDAMQLVDKVLPTLPQAEARDFRDRLREVTVRLIRIRTVEEEMRYDVAYFAAEAGRTIQVVLENHDLMPHNLVFTQPGALKSVATAALEAGPRGINGGKPYVPASDEVLHATGLVGVDGKAVLTFEAPTVPGEYPYVCTFPQHWYRMYGVMVVVDDLEAWNADPKIPADPIGNNRSFVSAWQSSDFADDLTQDLRGRSPEIGKKIFKEATCASCHQIAGEGGQIGPALDSVMTKWKGNPRELLREILHPSDRIDDKYAMYIVLTLDGETFSGLLVDQDDEVVQLLANAEAKEPTVIEKDEIDEMIKTKTSIMPKALIDQYTQDEIFELLSYLQSVGNSPVP